MDDEAVGLIKTGQFQGEYTRVSGRNAAHENQKWLMCTTVLRGTSTSWIWQQSIYDLVSRGWIFDEAKVQKSYWITFG